MTRVIDASDYSAVELLNRVESVEKTIVQVQEKIVYVETSFDPTDIKQEIADLNDFIQDAKCMCNENNMIQRINDVNNTLTGEITELKNKHLTDINELQSRTTVLETSTTTSVLQKLICDTIYPVGSVMVRYDSINPTTLAGFSHTTWSQLTIGRYLYTSTSAGSTGGSSTSGATTLTTSQMPSHTHTISGTIGSNGSHNHTFSSGSAASNGEHTHSTSGTTASNGAHTHTAQSGGNDIQFALVSNGWTSGTISKSYTHDTSLFDYGGSGGWGSPIDFSYNAKHTHSTDSQGAHTHSTSGTAASAGAHTHSVTGTISTVSSHTHSFSGSSGSAGSDSSHTHTITPPYITVVAWRRTA